MECYLITNDSKEIGIIVQRHSVSTMALCKNSASSALNVLLQQSLEFYHDCKVLERSIKSAIPTHEISLSLITPQERHAIKVPDYLYALALLNAQTNKHLKISDIEYCTIGRKHA